MSHDPITLRCNMIRLLVARHGQSVWNAAGRWQGRADPPLSEIGMEQAKAAAASVGAVEAVLASPLERALVTATVISETIGVGPVMITLAVTIPAGLAFLLPISSPPNAISFAAGHYSIREIVRIGWPMTVSAVVVVAIVIIIWWDMILGVGSW